MSIHLIMPMGGSGSRFSERGFDLPKPLIPIHDRPFFYWATESVRKFIKLKSLTFVVLNEHVKQYGIDKVILQFYPEARIHILDHVLEGAVLTCLEGVKSINDGAPVLFNDCDHIFTCNEFYKFCEIGKFDDIDGSLLTFYSADPKYSFLELDNGGYVIRTAEKEVISNEAVCGAYFFRNRKIFEQSSSVYLNECTYKEFFLSGVYNIMACHKMRIKSFKVEMHLPFGTPDEYDAALKSEAFKIFL